MWSALQKKVGSDSRANAIVNVEKGSETMITDLRILRILVQEQEGGGDPVLIARWLGRDLQPVGDQVTDVDRIVSTYYDSGRDLRVADDADLAVALADHYGDTEATEPVYILVMPEDWWPNDDAVVDLEADVLWDDAPPEATYTIPDSLDV